MSPKPPNKLIIRIMVVIASILLVGCMDTAAAAPANQQNLAACYDWSDGIENIYVEDKYSTILDELERFRDWQGEQRSKMAFRVFANQVKIMSDAHTVQIVDNKFVRITIVFISPDIARTAILNEMPSSLTGLNDTDIIKIKEKTSAYMSRLVQQKEYFFLVILTTSADCDNSIPTVGCRVTLPIGSLIALDTSDNQMAPQHDDRFLEREIYLINGWESGFVSYSMGARSNAGCDIWFLNPNTNTSITLGSPRFMDVDPMTELTFSFPYQSLLLSKNKTWFSGEPESIEINLNSINITDVVKPPLPTKMNFREENEFYNQEMAYFVWYKLFQGIFFESSPSTGAQAEVKPVP